jgi:hypothetical protein
MIVTMIRPRIPPAASLFSTVSNFDLYSEPKTEAMIMYARMARRPKKAWERSRADSILSFGPRNWGFEDLIIRGSNS